MIPTLIVLGMLAMGVAIVAFATRRPATRQDVLVDQDTAWGDPITPAGVAAAEADPFAHAPVMTPPVLTEPLVSEPLRSEPLAVKRAS